MNIILISYELGGPETSASYYKLIEEIKALGTRCKPMRSLRLIKTSLEPKGVFHKLEIHLDTNDKMMCVDIKSKPWRTGGLSEEVLQWIHKNI